MGNKGIKVFLSVGLACLIIFLSSLLNITDAAFPGTEKSSMAISSRFDTNLINSINKNDEINTEGADSHSTIIAAKHIKVIPGGQPIGVKLHTDGPCIPDNGDPGQPRCCLKKAAVRPLARSAVFAS